MALNMYSDAVPDWSVIDTVLLDLDGTLLDLAFDNHIWLGRVPELYAAANGLSVPEALKRLAPKFRNLEGTLEWYNIEYWGRELGLDIVALHHAERARIAWLPGARGFLESLRLAGKRLVLLTNSHPAILEIKHQHTQLRRFFDSVHSSHDFGAPKEDARFWTAVRVREGFDPARCLFVDDSSRVLRAARGAGIRWVYAVRHSDSTRGKRQHDEFPAVDAVNDLLAD
jgi:HAD superfamily hydrolase (TIGR01509 family)